jgi:hypothetical protein
MCHVEIVWLDCRKYHNRDLCTQSKKHKRFPATGLEKPLGFQEVEALEFEDSLAHEGGKVVSPTHWLCLSPGRIPGTQFC